MQEDYTVRLHFFFFASTERKDDNMNSYTIAFTSVTIAMKAQSVLRSKGFFTEVIRTPRNLASGCGYSLVLSGEIEEAIDYLEKSGIKHKAVMENK